MMRSVGYRRIFLISVYIVYNVTRFIIIDPVPTGYLRRLIEKSKSIYDRC